MSGQSKHMDGMTIGRNRGAYATYSIWVDADRETLKLRIAERRHQQRLPSDQELIHEPWMSANMSLKSKTWRENRS